MDTSVELVAKTKSPYCCGTVITTLQVTMPRYLLAELNTHRLLTKSAESSRAIPVKNRIKMVEEAPYVPHRFGKNQPGMVDAGELGADVVGKAVGVWEKAAKAAVECARELDKLGVSKQVANRLLEPFCYVRVAVTATEWANFLNLRCSEEADPEFRRLAKLMGEVIEDAIPVESKFHLPYIDDGLMNSGEYDIDKLMRISAARCARISYKPFTETEPNPEKDLELAEKKLIPNMHLSPFDHVAIADEGGSNRHTRQYNGWIPYRVKLEKSVFGHVEFNSKERTYRSHFKDVVRSFYFGSL